MQPYLENIQYALRGALCLRSFPSEKVERHEKPEIEVATLMPDKKAKTNHLVFNPITITRGNKETCLIESSINSTRVISFI